MSEEQDFVSIRILSCEFFVVGRLYVTDVRFHQSDCKLSDFSIVVERTSVFVTFNTSIRLVDEDGRMFKDLEFIFTKSVFFNTVDSCNLKNTIISARELFITVLQIYRLLLVRFVEQNNPDFLTTEELRKAAHFDFINIALTKEISALLLLAATLSEMELLMTTATTASSTEELAEHIIETTAATAEVEVMTTTMTAALTLLLFKTFFTISIIDFFLFGIFQGFVGFHDFMELLFSFFRIIFILIWVILQ